MIEFSGYHWHDFVGNVGVAMIVGTYLLLQIGRMRSTAVAYSLLNALGAILIVVSLCFDFNLSSMIIEIFWLAISGYGLWRAAKTGAGEER